MAVRGILAVAVLLGGLLAATPAPVRAETGGATHFVFENAWEPCVTAGTPCSFDVVAQDAQGNDTNYFSDGVHFTSSDPLAILPADYVYTWGGLGGDFGGHEFSFIFRTAGPQTLYVTDISSPSITGILTGIYVWPGPVARLVETVPSSTTAGAESQVSVRAEDLWHNLVTGYAGTVHFSSTDSAATLPADYAFSPDDQGVANLLATLRTAGSQSITVADLAQPALTDTQTTSVSTAPHLIIILFATMSAGASGYSYEVQALDALNNIATGYTGTIHFSSSDTQADLPADYTFQAADHGDAWVSGLTLKTAGSQWVRVVDIANNLIQGASGTSVTPGPSTSVVLDGPPSEELAGSQASVFVILWDSYHNVETNYVGGSVQFTSSDPQAVLPPVYQFVAGDHGMHGFSVTFKTAGLQTVSVTAGSLSDSESTWVFSAGTARFSVSGFPSPTVAGAAHNLTVTARDSYGNPTPAYHGTVHFTSSDPVATLPADYTFTATDAGVHTFSVTLKTVGGPSVTAADTVTTSITGSQTGIVVNPGAATHLAVSGYPSPTVAGVAHNLTVTAKDAYGNTATGYTGTGYTGTIHFTSTDPKAVLPADYTFTAGDHGTHTFSVTLKTAGSRSVTATDKTTASITGSQTAIVVNPGAAKTLSVGTFNPFPAGSTHSVTVKALDAYGNIAAAYLGTIHFTSSDAKATLPADYTFTAADKGVHTFSLALVLKTAGSQWVRAADKTTASITGSQTVSVTPGAAKTLSVGTFNPFPAGSTHTVTVTARDAYGNVATGYLGTIHYTSSDTKATLPADYTFTASDKGVHTFSLALVLKSAGSQWVRATDKTTASITGAQTVTVTPGAAKTLSVGTFNPFPAGSTHSVTVKALDAYGNVAVGYLGTIHFTSSDTKATLPADYTFTAADKGVHTFSLALVLKTVGSQWVRATDKTTASITGAQTVTVTS